MNILRTSERKDFKRCQARWWWRWREGLQAKSSSTPLWFGTGVHLALERWYVPGVRRGIHPAETFLDFAAEGFHTIKTRDATEEQVAEYIDAQELGIRLMEEYVSEYGDDSHIDVIQSEQTFSIDVPWPEQTLYIVERGQILTRYNGKWDGVYRDLNDGNKLKLFEHKTAKAIMLAHLTLDDQAGSYWAIATASLRKMKLIKSSEQLHGITYNFIRKALPYRGPVDAEGYATNKPQKSHYIEALGPRLANEKMKLVDLEELARKRRLTVVGDRSKTQPLPVFVRHDVHRTSKERATQLRRIQSEGVQMQLARDGWMPLTKTPTRDCWWDCSFFSMCELQERGGEWKMFRDAMYTVEDPYKDHRKSTEE